MFGVETRSEEANYPKRVAEGAKTHGDVEFVDFVDDGGAEEARQCKAKVKRSDGCESK